MEMENIYPIYLRFKVKPAAVKNPSRIARRTTIGQQQLLSQKWKLPGSTVQKIEGVFSQHRT